MDLGFVKSELLAAELADEICGADLEALWSSQLRAAGNRALAVEAVTNRTPFVIRSDGSIDEELSMILRRFADQVPGRTTMETYARHAFRLLLTMARDGMDLRTVSFTYLADYRRIRNAAEIRRKDAGGKSRRRKPISWNAEASALKSFFDAVVVSGIRLDNPCQHKSLNWHIGGAMAAPEEPDFVTLADFERFRDEGLAAGTYGLRNVAFANLLLTSGMRLSEANDYKAAQLPSLEEARMGRGRSTPHRVSRHSAKGSRSRWVRITKGTFESMRSYDEILREGLIAKLGEQDPPEAFWLNQHAGGMQGGGWNYVFRRATELTGIRVTPKTLRHTCAVYLLSRLLKAMLKSISDVRAEAQKLKGGSETEVLYSVFGDPLRKVQKYLGHKRYETTFIYLDILGSREQITDDALAVFDEVISAEEAFDVAF